MHYGLLGPLEASAGDRPVEIRGTKERALLALLLLDGNRLVSSERLIDELWGDEPPHTARKSLQVRVSHLRKALRAAGSDGLVSSGGGYLLRVQPGELDLQQFERLLAEADGATPADAAARLREALCLWRGQALADLLDEPFARRAAARLEELRLVAVERRVESDLALGRHADLVGELEGLVTLHPFREQLCAQLMRALYGCGRQAEALAAYRAARRRLIDGLGIEPGPVLRRLEGAILRQDPALAPSDPLAQERGILIAAHADGEMQPLVALGKALAARSRHELIVVRPVAAHGDLASATALLNKQRRELLADGLSARAASFTSAGASRELVRIAAEEDVDLLLLSGAPELARPGLRDVLEQAPCDVAVLVRRPTPPTAGPVLVPFTGTDQDWAAAELGAWLAAAWRSPLRLVGAARRSEDASRLLAHAALAVQRGLGVTTEPVLVAPTAAELIRVADDAALVVLGLPERWRREGAGTVRLALARAARPPTLLVRRGARPGGLAPRESRTRFTWSLGA